MAPTWGEWEVASHGVPLFHLQVPCPKAFLCLWHLIFSHAQDLGVSDNKMPRWDCHP